MAGAESPVRALGRRLEALRPGAAQELGLETEASVVEAPSTPQQDDFLAALSRAFKESEEKAREADQKAAASEAEAEADALLRAALGTDESGKLPG